MKISLCMIVKNEEGTLARCLESAKEIADEIIIIDTGSSDRTKEIAKKYTNNVFDFKWIDNFSAARNFSFSKASHEYIMWLDADDVIEKNSIKKIKQLKESIEESISAVYCVYNVAFDESDKPTFSYYRERIVKKSSNPVWIEPVHEVISYTGNHMLSDITIEHRKKKINPPGRNLKILEKYSKNNILSARLNFYYARELMYNEKYIKAIKTFEEFLEDKNGWGENKIEATRDVSKCYKKIKNRDKAYESLLKGFLYGSPRAETLCALGEMCYEDKKYEDAKNWYILALGAGKNLENLGFVQEDFYNFIPAIQLCLIHDKLGNKTEAKKYNDLAGEFKPNNPSYLYNKKYFEKILKEK